MQKLVVENDSHEFAERVNELLKAGYKIVPESLIVHLSPYEKIFLVVLE